MSQYQCRGDQMRVLLVLAFLPLILSLNSCVEIEDGTVGVSKRLGKIAEETLDPGLYLNVPVLREVTPWDVKTQPRTLRLDIPTSENLIVRIEATVLFKPRDVVSIRTKVGEDYVERVLDSTMIDTFREVVGKQKIEDLINSQETIAAQVLATLKEVLGERGIEIEKLLITGLVLPEKFREAIERKLESQQKAQQKEFELKQAEKDAEIEITRAKGAAKAQEIVRSTLSPAYLQYYWIKTLQNKDNVIYVATEANMPVFRSREDSKK